jgi:hypothetical protein
MPVAPDEIPQALKRARERAQMARAIARQMSIRQTRDALLLEAVAIESVIRRIEARLGDAQSEDLSELTADIGRLTSVLAGEKVDPDIAEPPPA